MGIKYILILLLVKSTKIDDSSHNKLRIQLKWGLTITFLLTNNTNDISYYDRMERYRFAQINCDN